MSWEFKVGMKVVCCDDSFVSSTWNSVQNRPIAHHVYTIREIVTLHYFVEGAVPSLLLEEVRNDKLHWVGNGVCEWGFSFRRFRPVVSKPDAIEQFREIARGVSNGKPIIDDPMPTKRVLEEMTP